MSVTPPVADDPWAWARATSEEPPLNLAGVTVAALLVAPEADLARLVADVASQTVAPTQIVVGSTSAVPDLVAGDIPVHVVPTTDLEELRAQAGGEPSHYWVLRPDTELELPPGTLEALLRTLAGEPGADVTAPLVLRRATRRSGAVIEWAGVTLTPGGIPVSPAAAGEVDQGQVGSPQVLGVPTVAMLSSADAIERAGGFGSGVLAGLELGTVLAATAGRVTVTGDTAVTLVGEGRDPAEVRLAGLNLAAAVSRAPGWTAVRTVVGSLLAMVGAVLMRDLRHARVIGTALRSWLRAGRTRARLRQRFAAAAPNPDRVRMRSLRMSRGEMLKQALTALSGRIGDWVDGFTARIDSGSVIDDLTSDEAPVGRTQWRLSPAVVGFVVLIVLAAVAGMHLYTAGRVTGELLLPAPDFGELWARYLDPVAGQPPGSGAPWLAVVGVASLLTIGNVDLAVTLSLLLTVPLTWLATYRLLRQLLTEQALAVLAALMIALAPVLSGGVSRGSLAAAWAVLLVVLTALSGLRLARERSWRWAVACGVALTLLTAGTPLFWVPALGVGIWAAVTLRVNWWHAAAALAIPVLWLSPWVPTLWRWPARLLTGPEPVIVTEPAPDVWWLLLARDAGSGLPPLWLGVTVIGVLWVLAGAGLVRGGARTWPGWVLAITGLLVAVTLGKLPLPVPPGAWGHADLTVWLAILVSGLALAAVLGCDGIFSELRGSSLGWRQVLAAALALAAAGAAVLGTGWWVLGGTAGLVRGEGATIPPFVRNAQTSATPGRTLVIAVRGEVADWALTEGHMPRLGDGERGTAAGGSQAAHEQAANVVARLLAGTADDALVTDLQTLGVRHVWVGGGSEHVLSAIGNTPGLGTGSGDDTGWVWQVPESGRTVVSSGSDRTVVGTGVDLDAGADGRELVLAEPADPRWRATVGGVRLEPLPTADWRQRFGVPAAGGELKFELDAGPPWWAWLQLAGLIVALVMMAPGPREDAPVGSRGAV